MEEKFTFFRSFYKAIQLAPEEVRLGIYTGICAYVFDGEIPEFYDRDSLMAWTLIKPHLDASMKHSADGEKGGRPAKNPVKNPVKKPPFKQAKKPPLSNEKSPLKSGDKSNMNMNMNMNKEELSSSERLLNSSSCEIPICPKCGSTVSWDVGKEGFYCSQCNEYFEKVDWRENA